MGIIPSFNTKFQRDQILVDVLMVDVWQLVVNVFDCVHQRVEEGKFRLQNNRIHAAVVRKFLAVDRLFEADATM